ncbi:Flavin monooxygenase-like protein [Cordyceps fumosorosea ARSEF 2679]|uniref:Flavin monooxygenase-like protein n=1 Tax=Cordyceps fumosorosea (strain ARSEF 2679) TaxID=1081104 RepID=A0A168E4Z0_CORFA|nr:Flavin monooxygenase-like protein [Cordyceps fumosorosea ARSEF 2679]OAA73381.1 Flavin monooxygenase-like protein [Cordyceps fumosorosea ARSEF 2679]
MEKLDCAVIGSGIYGLASAKQYHVTHPSDKLAIYESNPSLGGTWSEERLYPCLRTNNLRGTFEYPDFPLEAVDIEPAKDHIPGETVNAYLKAYAARFGVDKLIHFNTKVNVAEHQEDDTSGGWILTLEGPAGDGAQTRVFTRRLIVATGGTSDPIMPTFIDQDTFGRPIFHSKDFPRYSETLKTAKRATVYGVGKFAWDVAYAYATSGVTVDWVIRASGHGLGWVAPPRVSPFKIWLEKLAHIRAMTWFSPSIWSDTDGFSWIQRFLHGTWLGRLAVKAVWNIISHDVHRILALDKHPETAKMKAKTPIMYASTSVGILNYEEDIFEFVRNGMIKLHFADVEKLSPGKVHLSDRTTVESDVLMAYGGWQQIPTVKFLPEGIEAELGLPHSRTDGEWDPKTGKQAQLIKRADEEILTKLPMLKNFPQFPNYVPVTKQDGVMTSSPKARTSFMMYRFLAPQSARLLRSHDIAFTGLNMNFSNVTTAHVAGLWISAFFDGKLDHDPCAIATDEDAYEKLRYQTVLYNRYGRWRHPLDWGDRPPCFIFDALTYVSILLRDLGLKTHRKDSLFQEIFGSYGVEDYRNLNEEWAAAQAIKSKKD